MQIYGNNNYDKGLVGFSREISTLTKAIDKHMAKDLFAETFTGNIYSCLPLDMWIKMVMNKGSKMKVGLKNLLKNETMLLSRTRKANFINRIRVSKWMKKEFKILRTAFLSSSVIHLILPTQWKGLYTPEK